MVLTVTRTITVYVLTSESLFSSIIIAVDSLVLDEIQIYGSVYPMIKLLIFLTKIYSYHLSCQAVAITMQLYKATAARSRLKAFVLVEMGYSTLCRIYFLK